MKSAVLTALALLAAPNVASGQLAERVAEQEDGVVTFSYDARQGVEICDQGIRWGESTMRWHFESRGANDDHRGTGCRTGTVEVQLELRRGVVRDVEVVRGPANRWSDARSLGAIPAVGAAEYLLSLAYGGAGSDAAEDAVMPAMLADVEGLWRDVLRLAEDRSLEEGVRKNALFWLGQEAAASVTEELAGVALDDGEEREIRDAAIFALSQRPSDEGVPILMELARSGDDVETRRKAMFWLAQSGDERVTAFFERLLSGGGG